MPFTGSGFESSLSGGSFLGKKNSSSSRNSERYRGSSNCLSVISSCSSGSGPGGFGFIDWDPIIPSSEVLIIPVRKNRCNYLCRFPRKRYLFLTKDERHLLQVASNPT